MTKAELKAAIKLIDSMSSLLETGFFPGRKAPKVLDALRYIQLMKQEFNAHVTNSNKSTEEVVEASQPVSVSAPEAGT